MINELKFARLIGSRGAIVVAAILLAVAYPYTVNDFWVSHIAGRTLGFGTIALSLVFLSAYTGMLSLAQMTVAGIAGYALAYALAPIAGFAPLSWAMAVAVALSCAVAAGTLVGFVAVRTEGVATLMITLAIAMAFYYLTLQNYALFNGYDGFTSVRAPEVLGIALDKPRPLYFLSLLVATGCYLGVRWLSTAPLGLALQAMRDNPRRLRALGYPVGVLRVIASAIAGLIAGLGGLLNVWHNGSISPGSVGINAIMDVLVVAVLGGLRHPIGAFVGALAFSVIQSFAIVVVGPERFNTAIGTAFIAVVVFSPDGIVGLIGEIRRRGRSGTMADESPLPAICQERRSTMITRRQFGSLASAALCLAAAPALAQRRTIRIGTLATLDGPLALLGKDAFRCLDMAVAELGGSIAGASVELFRASSDSKPDVALAAARRLVEQDKVDMFIGPPSGSEGIRIKDYAKTVPGVTFINGSSAAIETTLVEPARNFYRFNPDGAQTTAALGQYIKEKKGWSRIVVVAEDYSFPYAQVFGLMGTYCAAGGHVPRKFFVPLGSKDYSAVIAQLPGKDKADAVFVVLGGADAVNFLTQYAQAGGELPIIGGSLTVDQTVLSAKGPVRAHLPGVLSSGPISDNDTSPAWQAFVERYHKTYPDGLPSPSYPGVEYYISTKAALLALRAVGGDLSDGHARLRATLDRLAFDTPTGPTWLNKNRQAAVTVFVNEVVEKNGRLTTTPVQRVEAVDQFLGLGEEAYRKLGAPSRDNPSCAA